MTVGLGELFELCIIQRLWYRKVIDFPLTIEKDVFNMEYIKLEYVIFLIAFYINHQLLTCDLKSEMISAHSSFLISQTVV